MLPSFLMSFKALVTSSSRFFSGTLLSRFSGLGRDVVTAAYFGVTPLLAALLVAIRLVHLPRRVFGEGAMQSAFVPAFERLREESKQKAVHFFIELFTLLFIGLSILAFGTSLLLHTLEQSSYFSADAKQILFFSKWMCPSFVFISLYGLSFSYLSCEKCFFIPSLTPLFYNLTWIATVLFMGGQEESRALFVLALMINVACFVQWAMTLPQVFLSIREEFSLAAFSFQFDSVRQIFPAFILSLTGVAAQQINSALDPLFARFADASGPAYLWYSLRIQQLPLALFGIAIASVTLPVLSKAVAKGESGVSPLREALRLNLILILPILFCYFFFGPEGVALLYERGDFSVGATAYTTLCLWAYTLGLLPATLILILAPLYFARKNYKIPTIASSAAVVTNIVLNAFFVFGMGLSSVSVAIATSISAFVNLGFLLYALDSSARQVFFETHFSLFSCRVLIAALFGTASALFATYQLTHDLPFLHLFTSEPLLAHVFSAQATRFGVILAAFFLPYSSLLTLFHYPGFFMNTRKTVT